MRLWHKHLIEVLPREQLVAQWRECSAIAGNIKTKGTPNHILVNKIMNYPMNHFISYSFYLRQEMTRRGYRTMNSVWNKICSVCDDYNILPIEELYPDWHNKKYMRQCIYNLEEKYDCGGIKEEDFKKIVDVYVKKYTEEDYVLD
jgi:uncharacterized protein (TIGR02328 family)